MDLAKMFYLVGLISNIKFFLVLTIIGTVVFSFFIGANLPDKALLPFFMKALLILLLQAVVEIGLPSEKTMYLMAGTEVAKQISENPEIVKISNKMLNILDKKLDELQEKE